MRDSPGLACNLIPAKTIGKLALPRQVVSHQRQPRSRLGQAISVSVNRAAHPQVDSEDGATAM